MIASPPQKQPGPEDAQKKEPITLTRLMLIILLLRVGYCCAMLYLVEGWQTRGLFGDMFGSVNALFSGAALLGVIYAIFQQRTQIELQRTELQHQREELTLTREELKRSADAQVKSEESFTEQLAEMQKQTRLQLTPLVALRITLKQGKTPIVELTNAGNGAAVNVGSMT